MTKIIFDLSESMKEKYDLWKVLILEDDPERMKYFKMSLNSVGAEMTHVETAKECIEEMKKETFDWIFLDHDLGGEIYVNTENENTGSEVARWMNKNLDKFENSQIIIHSFNEPASRVMRTYVSKARYCPGCWIGLKIHHKRKNKNER